MDGTAAARGGAGRHVTGGGERTAWNTKGNRTGHLGGVKGDWKKGRQSPSAVKIRLVQLNRGNSLIERSPLPERLESQQGAGQRWSDRCKQTAAQLS